MSENSKPKTLFVTVFLTILLISSAYAALLPKVQAAEMTIQQKGLAVLSDVVNIDTAKYATRIKEYPQDSYLGVLPQENVRYELSSNESKLEMLCTFTNGKLHMIHVLENEGSPRTTKTSNSALEMAKDFLGNYQSYSGNSFYEELRSSLANVDATKNSTKTAGNTKLEVVSSGNRVTFRWTFTLNGTDATDKVVALSYENGFLKLFLDNWNLYQIGSTNVNLSEEEAIDIAMTRASNYSWAAKVDNVTYEIKNFNITRGKIIETVFRTSLVADKVRNKDPLTLYPMRHVWISLDKFYPPGNIYGLNVYIWADTGEVAKIQPRFTTLEPPPELVATIADITNSTPLNNQTAVSESKSNSLQTVWLALPALAALTLGVAPIWLIRKKNLPLRRFFKTVGILLCLLSLSLLLVPITSVGATYPYGRATIWGSESIGAWDDRLGYHVSWRKAPWEVSQQQSTAADVASSFSNNGYYASNYQGSNGLGSMKDVILDQVWINEAVYPRVAVVDFDHGNGSNETGIMGAPPSEFHYMFEDNFGVYDGTPENPGPRLNNHAVYDMEIYDKTAFGRTFFSFISTCNSAHIADSFYGQYDSWQGLVGGRARGMPFAWTHRLVKNRDTYPGFNTAQHMSDDGYNRPDGGNFVYIGFVGGSASLSQTVSGSWPYYHTWVEEFFAYALIYDMSVKDALDHASYVLWPGYYFDQTPLRAGNGFWAIWEVWNPSQGWHNLMGGSWGKMAVYGNGGIHLHQYELTVNALDQYGYTVPGVQVYVDGVTLGQAGTSWKLVPGSHQLQVNVPTEYSFQYFEGYPWGQNPITVQLTSDHMTVTARYTRNNPTYYTLSISSSGGGYTIPTGDQQYLSNTYAHVEAHADAGWVLDHWQLDTSNMGSNPTIDVYMDGPHTLQAVFVPAPAYNFVSSITGYDGPVYNPAGLVGWQPDGQFAEIAGYGPYYYYGWISGAMNAQAAGHIYLYGYGDGPLYVYASSDGYYYNLVSVPYVSSGSPYWIDCGNYLNPFNYIAVTAEDPNYFYSIALDSVRVDPPTYHTLTISSGGGGSTTPSPGAYQYAEGTPVAVTANPDSGYVLDYWLLDGQNAGSQNPITVTMNSDHTLQANFREGTQQHSLTVNAYGTDGVQGYVPLQIDGQGMGYTPYTGTVSEDQHQIYVDPGPFYGDYSVYWFGYWTVNGVVYYDNPVTVYINQDTTATAWYYHYP